MQTEFSELAKTDRLSEILERGLLRVNATRVTSVELAESLRLKNMDVIDRIVHWHEPPVLVPANQLGVQKVFLPDVVCHEHGLEDGLIYVCDKPSTVPVHPAGPYLANSMTIMVEAQEGLSPRSLIPCHRIDRVTSGLTICCTDVKVARLVQARISDGSVKKQYLAKIQGQFPRSLQEAGVRCPDSSEIAKWQWQDERQILQVDGPIETVDPANGIRRMTVNGKPSTSLFQLLSYSAETNTSIITCCPLTGRSHQLRVHLQWLGFSICDDIQYGGKQGEGSTFIGGVHDVINRIEHMTRDGAAPRAPTDLSEDDVRAARDICPCCRDMASAFTASQLLQGGHQICLHAFRYQVPFFPKARKTREFPIATMDLQVSLPIWAKDANCDKIQWLK